MKWLQVQTCQECGQTTAHTFETEPNDEQIAALIAAGMVSVTQAAEQRAQAAEAARDAALGEAAVLMKALQAYMIPAGDTPEELYQQGKVALTATPQAEQAARVLAVGLQWWQIKTGRYSEEFYGEELTEARIAYKHAVEVRTFQAMCEAFAALDAVRALDAGGAAASQCRGEESKGA